MNQLMLKLPENHDPICAATTKMAKQELAAFFSAVTELFGSGEAELSAEDWLHELMAIKDLPASPRQWRVLSIKASARLANRVNASSISTSTAREHSHIHNKRNF